MHKIIGEFDTEKQALCIAIDSKKQPSLDLWKKILGYVQANMFIAFRRQAARCKKIVLSSVGDHLNKYDEQDIAKAEIFLDIELRKELTATEYDKIAAGLVWHIEVDLLKGTEVSQRLEFTISKIDDMMLERKHTNYDTI